LPILGVLGTELISSVKFVPETGLNVEGKYSVDSPPGRIDNRVFIGGKYTLMPILREIEATVKELGFQPIIARDFDIPKVRTRDDTIRLLYQCKYFIFEVTLPDGHFIEIVRTSTLIDRHELYLFMAQDERREQPETVSFMLWQGAPVKGYLTIAELRNQVVDFLRTP
jgi:signal recognition particle subunit SEC65